MSKVAASLSLLTRREHAVLVACGTAPWERHLTVVRATLLSLGLFVGCRPTIPPPVTASSAKTDEHSATPNPANVDPNLKPPFGPFDVQTAFYIDKSNDRDRVDYGMRLDEHCTPLDAAVFPYWRELEHAPPVRSHPLTFLQYFAYGLSEQRLLARSDGGGQYRVQLKQVDRPLLIVTAQDGARHCTTTAYVRIQSVPNARLDHIFVKVAGSMSVDYVEVYGSDPKTGAALVERLKR
jgi:hypothetical protein